MSSLLSCLTEWGDLSVEKWWEESMNEWLDFRPQGEVSRDLCATPRAKISRKSRGRKGYWDNVDNKQVGGSS